MEGGYRGFQLAKGGVSVDEVGLPDGSTGCAFRALDFAARRWSAAATADWVFPSNGGFDGGIGQFYGDDRHGGAPVKVRFVWHRPQDHAPRLRVSSLAR